MLFVLLLLIIYPINARNTLHILPFYSMQAFKDTKYEEYLYGLDFTSRNYAERIGDRFESKTVRKNTYTSTRLHSLRLFFPRVTLASKISPLVGSRNFQVFGIGEDLLCYKSWYLMYKKYDNMEFVCAPPTVHHPSVGLVDNFLRVAPDLDELQRVQDEMVDKRYPKIKYEKLDKQRQDIKFYEFGMLVDYRPDHLPPPYSSWPYRTVIKSLAMNFAEIYTTEIERGKNMSLKRFIGVLRNTYFEHSHIHSQRIDAPIKIIRLLKQPVDTYRIWRAVLSRRD